MTERGGAGKDTLHTDKLSKHYGNEVKAVNELDLKKMKVGRIE